MKTLERITFDPAVMGGRPCIRGLRVTVGLGGNRQQRSEVEVMGEQHVAVGSCHAITAASVAPGSPTADQ